MRIPGKKILDIFKGIDTNKDKQLSHKELYNMGKEAGLKKGWIVDERAEVADSFMDKFDTNKDNSVSWKEFQKKSKAAKPPRTALTMAKASVMEDAKEGDMRRSRLRRYRGRRRKANASQK